MRVHTINKVHTQCWIWALGGLTAYLPAVEVGAVGLHKDLQADLHAGELGTVGLHKDLQADLHAGELGTVGLQEL